MHHLMRSVSHFIFLVLALNIHAVTYYVAPAPAGSDGNPGTQSQPFATLAKARDVVKTINTSMTDNITVYLRGGTYYQSSTLSFDQSCSGTNGYNVIFQAYGTERPIISGGNVITGWTMHDAARNIYKVTGINYKLRQLYVNNKKAIRARSPNVDMSKPYPLVGRTGFITLASTDMDKTNMTIKVESSKIANWSNFTKVEMHLMQEWTDNILRLASFTTSGSVATVKFQAPENGVYFNRTFPDKFNNTYCYFENSLDLLDAAGEWYLDESSSTLYYKPLTGQNMTTAYCVAPRLPTMVQLMGTLDAPVHNIWFQGITFSHSTWTGPCDSGFVAFQASQYYTTGGTKHPPSGVYVACANNIRFQRNIFVFMAATALDFHYGTKDDDIYGNVFTDVGGIGVSVGETRNPTDTKRLCLNDSIANNYIYNVTTELQGATGIWCGYVTSVRILHNEIGWVNYSGISVGWGWTTNTTALSNNIINNNYVHDELQILTDGAGIYTLSYQPNSFITGNWKNGNVYLDQGSSGFTITNNTGSQDIKPNNTITSNTLSEATIQQNAGLEAAYKSIKNTDVTPVFYNQNPAKVMQKSGLKSVVKTEYFSVNGRLVQPKDIASTSAHTLFVKHIVFGDKSVSTRIVPGTAIAKGPIF